MKAIPHIITGLVIVLAAPGGGAQPSDESRDGIVRAHAKPAVPGPAANFTGGRVAVRPIAAAADIGHTGLGEVVFQPGARSHWHTHPGGQALYVTEGCGWTQRAGGPVVRICKGDTAYVPAGVKHWHGATATTAMTQYSITEEIDGKNVNWMEPVSDEQYRAGARAVE